MKQEAVIDFFNTLAPSWDAQMIRDDRIITRILDGAGVGEGDRVLDVATGTGVLIPDYLARGVAHVTGIDLSPEMARIARDKYASDPCVEILCADACTLPVDRCYDRIMIYNALPHFVSPAALFAHLGRMLAPGGTLTVAHGFGRKKLDDHHKETASDVSVPLPPTKELISYLREYLDVTVVIDTEEMFQLTGMR